MMQRNEIRTSQGIVPFGVGALVDFVDDTLMMAGLDAWPVANDDYKLKEATLVFDDRLAQRLSAEMGYRITHFKSPALAPELHRQVGQNMMPQQDRAEMPFVRFPNWHYCPRCRHMQKIPWNTRPREARLRCDNMGRLREGQGPTCGEFPNRRRPKLIPVRFVIACEAGHISDFPWEAWVHGGGTCSEETADLYFTSTVFPGPAAVQVECRRCGKRKTLVGAFRRENLAKVLPDGCLGHRPWLGPFGQEDCQQTEMQTIQRGASNAYFAKIAKSILIPPHSTKVAQVLAKPKVRELIEPLIAELDSSVVQTTVATLAKQHGITADDLTVAARDTFDGEKKSSGSRLTSENAFRYAEYHAFTGQRPPQEERRDFDLRPVVLEKYGEWFAKYFDAVALVSRLRETRVLQGFTRLIPYGPNPNPLSPLSLGEYDWLPGISVRGEGIFLRFRRQCLEEWSKKPSVAGRIGMITKSYNASDERSRRFNEDPSAEQIMIHTFAHVLIRQLAYESGYDASSIQERLYVSTGKDEMAGVLLYTASGDSEGTLGGLVRRGRPEYLANTVRAALKNAKYCSSDPLCIESSGQGLNSLNLAACHACSLLPETSCEMSNMLLDRALLVGLPVDEASAYFEV